MSDRPPPPPPPPPWQPPSDGFPPPPPPPASPDGRPLAPWTTRVGAILLDGLLLLVANLILTAAGGRLLGAILSIVFNFAYYGFLNGEQQQTAGKRVLNIAVVDERTGGRIGLQRGIVREVIPASASLVALVSLDLVPFAGIVVLADGLWPLWDARNQALHDKLVGSLVVRGGPSVDLG